MALPHLDAENIFFAPKLYFVYCEREKMVKRTKIFHYI